MKEVISLRLEESKTFDTGNGVYLVQIGGMLPHWKEDYSDLTEPWKECDLTFKDGRIDKAPYILVADRNKITVTDRKTGKETVIELAAVGQNLSGDISLQNGIHKDNTITLNEIAKDVDLCIVATDSCVMFQRIVKSANAEHTAEFKIAGNLPVEYHASDADGDKVPVTATAAEGGKIVEAFDKVKTIQVVREGSRVTETVAVKYPVKIDPTIITSSKCNYINEDPAWQDSTSSQLSLQTGTGSRRHAFLQFAIPGLVRADVISARLRLNYFSNANGDPVGKAINIYKCRRQDWSLPTWNNYKSGSAWGTAGALNTTTDVDTSLVSSAVFPASFGWVDFNLLNIVHDAIDNSLDVSIAINKAGAEYADFRQRTYSVESDRPQLNIYYRLAPAGRHPNHLGFLGNNRIMLNGIQPFNIGQSFENRNTAVKAMMTDWFFGAPPAPPAGGKIPYHLFFGGIH